VYVAESRLTLTNGTISRNTAVNAGGGGIGIDGYYDFTAALVRVATILQRSP
jgi:hypothetical protein